jgi:hypothetical protein
VVNSQPLAKEEKAHRNERAEKEKNHEPNNDGLVVSFDFIDKGWHGGSLLADSRLKMILPLGHKQGSQVV